MWVGYQHSPNIIYKIFTYFYKLIFKPPHMTLDTNEYRKVLEEKLVSKFKEEFFEKLGYIPHVVTRFTITEEETKVKMPLSILKSYFIPFLPIRYSKRYNLGSPARFRDLTDLRHIYCYIANKMGHSLSEVGKSLNNRDHTTVINSVRKFKSLIETDKEFREKYIKILNHIKKINNESSALADKHQIPDQPQPDLHTGQLSFKD